MPTSLFNTLLPDAYFQYVFVTDFSLTVLFFFFIKVNISLLADNTYNSRQYNSQYLTKHSSIFFIHICCHRQGTSAEARHNSLFTKKLHLKSLIHSSSIIFFIVTPVRYSHCLNRVFFLSSRTLSSIAPCPNLQMLPHYWPKG